MHQSVTLWRLTAPLCIFIFVFCSTNSLQARVDYPVKPVKPDLAADEHTTLLLDFTNPQNPAVKAMGDPKPITNETTRVSEGSASGLLTMAGPSNLNPAKFTIEMILRVPEGSDAVGATTVMRWNVKYDWNVMVRLNMLSSYGREGNAGLDKSFQLQANCAGNGWSIPAKAKGEWVYLAMGIDYRNRLSKAVVRDMDGNLLFKRMEMQGDGALNGVEGDADANRRWQQMFAAITKDARAGNVTELQIGQPGVEIKQLRLSDIYRKDILNLDAGLPESNAKRLLPGDIDPSRVESQTVLRNLGYEGYRNEAPFEVIERYIPLAANSKPIELKLRDMKVGLYSIYLYGSIAPAGREELERIWKPCPMEMQLLDSRGKQAAYGKRLLKQSFSPRRMQGFHLHIDQAGDYTVRLSLTESAQETARIRYIDMVDQLEGLPNIAIKSKQTMTTPTVPMQQLSTLTAERKARDKLIWSALPPLNIHLQVHGQAPAFAKSPEGVEIDKWETKAYAGKRHYYHGRNTIAPLDFVNSETGEVFTQEEILSGKPWPGPYSDDGTGVYFTKSEFPNLKHNIYNSPRANLLGKRAWLFIGLLGAHDHRALSLPKRYTESGDPEIGHDAAMALVRMAYDWPAVEMNLHEHRLNTHTGDLEYGSDWSRTRNGKYFYRGWSGAMQIDFMKSYDQIFPYIKDNKIFAKAVNEFIPWIKTPDDVIAFIDRQLVFAGVRDFHRGLIGAAPVEDYAAKLLGPHPQTKPFFDLTRQQVEIYPYGGTYQELYASALSRSGSYHIGSFMVYAFGDAKDTILKAKALRDARNLGVDLKMDLSNVDKYTKVRSAMDFIIDMWVAGGYPFMVGDASGGTHSSHEAYKRLDRSEAAIRAGFELSGHPRLAWLLQHRFNETDPAVIRAASGERDPILHNPSRVVADYGAIVEHGVEETDLNKKSAFTLTTVQGQGHSHNDYLDLNLYGLGMPMAVDLACRDEGNFWSRPGAAWSFLHNHAIAHPDEEPKTAGAQTGHPWIRSFEPPLVRSAYVDRTGDVQLQRDVIMMTVGDTQQTYAFDVQRLTGDAWHTWCFHGCESDDVQINTTMSPQVVRWTDRLLENTQKMGKAPADGNLTATWTLTRKERELKHNFKGGGVIKTRPAEQTILGERYDASLPQAKMRATLLGCAGDTILQGNPYSQTYAYAFPFIWAQRKAPADGRASVFPAVYEWYRGVKPLIAEARIVSDSPLSVQVKTTTGQIDTFIVTADSFSVVSRDAAGIRYIQTSGVDNFQTEGIAIKAEQDNCNATVSSIDYINRKITFDRVLPKNPKVCIGNDGHRSYLELTGEGRTFTYNHDLLVHEGEIKSINIIDEKSIELQTNQRLFHGEAGNRKHAGYAVTNESHTWEFRGFDKGTAIVQPTGEKLSEDIFTDANGDGRINVKTYEIGVGDTVSLPSSIVIKRKGTGYEVKSNVAMQGRIDGKAVSSR